MNNPLKNNCPNCYAVLNFNPQGQNLKCDYCRTEFDLNDLNSTKISQDFNNLEIYIYTCKDCGIEIISDINKPITSCVYCKSTEILKSKLEKTFEPDSLIPFKITKEEAIKIIKKHCKKNCLKPKEFNIKKHIKDIEGIYVPYWLYNIDSKGVIDADCKKISTWKSGGYKYTKTDKYNIKREGNISFESLLINGSKKFQSNIINSIEPFNYNELKKFNYSYISNFLFEKYGITKEKSIEEANNKAKDLFIEEMKKDIKGFDKITKIEDSINLYNVKSICVLLPVYFLNIKYKNDIYIFAINGQTGKVVGNIPIDIKRIIFIWISLFIIIFSLLLLLNLIKVVL